MHQEDGQVCITYGNDDSHLYIDQHTHSDLCGMRAHTHTHTRTHTRTHTPHTHTHTHHTHTPHTPHTHTHRGIYSVHSLRYVSIEYLANRQFWALVPPTLAPTTTPLAAVSTRGPYQRN